MEIDEAIEIKSREGEDFLHTDPDKLDEADRLSIEALTLVGELQRQPGRKESFRLPSQTKRREHEK
ncbi:hypothetical protein ES702_06576 [subsurface metagenome]